MPLAEVSRIDVIFPDRKVTDVADFNGDQAYTLDLRGCVVKYTNPPTCVPFTGLMTDHITDGHFVDRVNHRDDEGSQFIPKRMNPIDMVLGIHWCPDQNYFMVKFFGQLLSKTLVHNSPVLSAVSPLGATPPPEKRKVIAQERSASATAYAVQYFKQDKKENAALYASTACTVACVAAEVACQAACVLTIFFEPECSIACLVVSATCGVACEI
mgnify:CR=1 FL=1